MSKGGGSSKLLIKGQPVPTMQRVRGADQPFGAPVPTMRPVTGGPSTPQSGGSKQPGGWQRGPSVRSGRQEVVSVPIRWTMESVL
jgi:hypothetical protein